MSEHVMLTLQSVARVNTACVRGGRVVHMRPQSACHWRHCSVLIVQSAGEGFLSLSPGGWALVRILSKELVGVDAVVPAVLNHPFCPPSAQAACSRRLGAPRRARVSCCA